MNMTDLDEEIKKEENRKDKSEIITTWNWVKTMILFSIPFLNIIVGIYWLASKKTNPTKKNYIKAMIIMFFIILLMVVLHTIFLVSSGYYY